MSLQGSAAAALLVPNVLVYLIGESFRPNAKWVAFLISLVLAYMVAYLAVAANKMKWVVAFFNACLIFASAVGINEAANKQTMPQAQEKHVEIVFEELAAGEGAEGEAAETEEKGTRLFNSWIY